MRFGIMLQRALPHLLADTRLTPSTVTATCCTDGMALFRSMPMDDVWAESGISDLNRYLFGNRHLQIPDGWRELIVSNIN